jgi:hypothetical protein
MDAVRPALDTMDTARRLRTMSRRTTRCFPQPLPLMFTQPTLMILTRNADALVHGVPTYIDYASVIQFFNLFLAMTIFFLEALCI